MVCVKKFTVVSSLLFVWLVLIPLMIVSAEEAAVPNIKQKLMTAAREGRVDELRELLDDSGIKVNDMLSSEGTLLHSASQYGGPDAACLEFLLSKGADLTARDSTGNQPFHIACQLWNPVIVKWFLERPDDSFNRNAKNKVGKTPLIVSITEPTDDEENKAHRVECNRMLISNTRVDVNARDKFIKPPLWYIIAWDKYPETAEDFLKNARVDVLPLVSLQTGATLLKMLAEPSIIRESLIREEQKGDLLDAAIVRLINQDALNIVDEEGCSCLGTNIKTGDPIADPLQQVNPQTQNLMLQAWQERQEYYRDHIKDNFSPDVARLIATFVISSDPVPFQEFDIPEECRVG